MRDIDPATLNYQCLCLAAARAEQPEGIVPLAREMRDFLREDLSSAEVVDFATSVDNGLAKRIRERLAALGMSTAEAGIRATGSRSFVKNIFDGASVSPRGENLHSLARVLKVSPEWLLSGKDGIAPVDMHDARRTL